MTVTQLAMYFGALLVAFGAFFVVAWHAVDPKLHAKKVPPTQP